MKPLLLSVLALLIPAAHCSTISGQLEGNTQIFVEVDISPATFADAFVILHVDGQRVGVLCPAFNPTDCSSSSGAGSSRTSAATYVSIETRLQATAWNHAPHMVYASVESFFGRHISFASASVISSANSRITHLSSALNEQDADNAKIMNIVIFSKDRPSQLDLLTRSLKRCVNVE